MGIEQNEVILAHDFRNFWEAEIEGYTMQTVQDMLLELKKHPDVSMLIDVKWTDIKEYFWYIDKIIQAIYAVSVNEDVARLLKKQIVMEVYDETSIQAAREYGFEVFFTQYRNDNQFDYAATLQLCERYNIRVVGFCKETAFVIKNALPFFKDKGIKVYTYSTDSVDEYRELLKIGVDGIFTNYLTYEDIE